MGLVFKEKNILCHGTFKKETGDLFLKVPRKLQEVWETVFAHQVQEDSGPLRLGSFLASARAQQIKEGHGRTSQ